MQLQPADTAKPSIPSATRGDAALPIVASRGQAPVPTGEEGSPQVSRKPPPRYRADDPPRGWNIAEHASGLDGVLKTLHPGAPIDVGDQLAMLPDAWRAAAMGRHLFDLATWTSPQRILDFYRAGYLAVTHGIALPRATHRVEACEAQAAATYLDTLGRKPVSPADQLAFAGDTVGCRLTSLADSAAFVDGMLLAARDARSPAWRERAEQTRSRIDASLEQSAGHRSELLRWARDWTATKSPEAVARRLRPTSAGSLLDMPQPDRVALLGTVLEQAHGMLVELRDGDAPAPYQHALPVADRARLQVLTILTPHVLALDDLHLTALLETVAGSMEGMRVISDGAWCMDVLRQGGDAHARRVTLPLIWSALDLDVWRAQALHEIETDLEQSPLLDGLAPRLDCVRTAMRRNVASLAPRMAEPNGAALPPT